MKEQLLLFVWGALFFGINNSQGQQAILWQKSLGGTGEDYARSVSSTFDGGFIVAGSSTSNDGDVTGNHGGYDFWITKLSSMGTIEWQKSLGGTLGELAYSVIQSSDSGYVVAGYTLSNDGDVSGNHGDKDFWVIKIDSTGNLIWQI